MIGGITFLSLDLLVEAAQVSSQRHFKPWTPSYGSLGFEAFGVPGQIISHMCIIISSYASIVNCMIEIGYIVPNLLLMSGISSSSSIFIGLIPIIPILLQDSFSSSLFSKINWFLSLLLISNLLYLLFTTSADVTIGEPSKATVNSGLGILIFSFQCHQNVILTLTLVFFYLQPSRLSNS